MPIEGRLLLGWMPRDEALDFLLNKCVFDTPFTEAQAIDLWEEYKRRVAALAPRKCVIPQSLRVNNQERQAILKFKANPPAMQDRLHDVVKIDPRCLVAYQFYVVTARCENYKNLMRNDRQRIKYCLGRDIQTPTVEQVGNIRTIKLPHFEYDLLQSRDQLGRTNLTLREWPRLLCAVRLPDRMLLWGGYHRTYALLTQAEPDGLAAPPLVSLITSPAVDAFFSNSCNRPTVRDGVLGERPALFGDFFDDNFVMRVSFRKQRRQLRLDVTTNAWEFGFVDDEC